MSTIDIDDWALNASFRAALGDDNKPCHERMDCIGHCPMCQLMDTAEEPEPEL